MIGFVDTLCGKIAITHKHYGYAIWFISNSKCIVSRKRVKLKVENGIIYYKDVPIGNFVPMKCELFKNNIKDNIAQSLELVYNINS